MKKLISFLFLLLHIVNLPAMVTILVSEFANRVKELKRLDNPQLYFRVVHDELFDSLGNYYIWANNNRISFNSPSYEKRQLEERKALERKEFYSALISGSLKITGIGLSIVAFVMVAAYIKDLPVKPPTGVIVQAAKTPVQEVAKKIVPAVAKPAATIITSGGSRGVVASQAQLWAEAQRIYNIARMQGKNMSIDQIFYLLSRGINPLSR